MDRLRNLGFAIKDIGRLYTRLFEQHARDLQVTLAECRVLTYLQRNEGISQIRLAELTGIEPMSLVRILDRMEGDAWIERRPHPTDRRARQLYLRPEAQPTLERLFELSAEVRAKVLVGLDAEERQALIELLERVHRNLREATGDDAASGKAQSRVRAAAKAEGVSEMPGGARKRSR